MTGVIPTVPCPVPGCKGGGPYKKAAPRAAWGLRAVDWRERIAARHIFTHVEWHMTGYALEVSGDGPEDFFWADEAALAAHAVPSAFARYYAQAMEILREAAP